MSLYKDLNDVNLNLREFQEIAITDVEHVRITKRFKKKSSSHKQKKKWLGASVAVVAVFVVSFSLTTNTGIIASMPFVSGIVEKYMQPNQNTDFSAYKTAIGETAENERGKLTLNEVMLDDRQLVLSATFEPADGVIFDYQTHIAPKVKINGQDYSVTTGGESIELNDSMFTIYSDIVLSKAIDTENVHIEISYETWSHMLQDSEVIEQPWKFDVDVSQENLLAEKKVIELNKLVTLTNGDRVTIEKVVSTPISTTIYYDLSQSKSEDIRFAIKSDNGLNTFSSSYNSTDIGEVSYARFNGITWDETKNYFLVAFDIDDNKLIKTPIPIN